MGYLDDISTIAKTMASGSPLRNALDMTPHKSIARGALDGTMQFACLVSDAIPIDMASTVVKTLERVYASFVQTYLSTHNTIDISVDKNPNMFLKRFHQNIKVESTFEDLYQEYCVESDEEYDALMERIYNGTTKAYINEREQKMILFNFSEKFNSAVFESHKAQLEDSLAAIDFTPFPNIGNSPFYVSEAIGNRDANYAAYGITKAMDVAADLNLQRIKHADDIDKERYKLQNGGNLTPPSLLKDNDVKKTNEMQPYMMQVRLMAINENNEFVQFMDFIVGIKVVLHNIKSEEMIVNLQNALQNSGRLFNFIRWTTGEKSLVKDLLFHINDIKLDVANRSKGSSPWWSTLKRLKDTSKAQAAFFSRTQMVPQSTIVISSYEVDIIEKNYGYSLLNPVYATKIMKALFLMNFVIINEGTRTVEILYDGERAFQTYALETLEREVTLSSNKIGRELTRMVSR